jgi:hypothetical protein
MATNKMIAVKVGFRRIEHLVMAGCLRSLRLLVAKWRIKEVGFFPRDRAIIMSRSLREVPGVRRCRSVVREKSRLLPHRTGSAVAG